MRTRSLLIASLAGAALAAPVSAQAKTFCVGDAPCPPDGTPSAGITNALQGASQSQGHDTVLIGEGTFDATISFLSRNVTIRGAGRTKTIIRSATSSEAVATLRDGTIEDLTIEATNPDHDVTALALERTAARRVGVRAASGFPALDVGDGAVVEDSAIAVDRGYAVTAGCPAGCTIVRSTIASGGLALLAVDGGRLTGEDLHLRGTLGATDGASFDVRRARIVATDGDGDDDGGIGVGADQGSVGVLRQATITRAPGTEGKGVGAAVFGGGQGDGHLDLRGVVIDGYARPVARVIEEDQPAENIQAKAVPGDPQIVASASAWDRSGDAANLVAGTPNARFTDIVDLAGRSPGFVDGAAGDFRLRAGSPLIDAISGPAPDGFRDLLGAPATDGDGDGVAQADIGAFEAPAGPRRAAPAAQQPAPAGAQPAPPAAAPVPAKRPAVLPRALLDRTKPRLTRARLRGRTLQLTLSEAATVRVEAQKPARGKRFRRVGRVVSLRAKAGANRLRLRLPKGARRIVVAATDAAGNRSAPKRLAIG